MTNAEDSPMDGSRFDRLDRGRPDCGSMVSALVSLPVCSGDGSSWVGMFRTPRLIGSGKSASKLALFCVCPGPGGPELGSAHRRMAWPQPRSLAVDGGSISRGLDGSFCVGNVGFSKPWRRRLPNRHSALDGRIFGAVALLLDPTSLAGPFNIRRRSGRRGLGV